LEKVTASITGRDILQNRLPAGTSLITHFTLGAYVTGNHETYLFNDEASLRTGVLRPDYVLYDPKSR
jgi:hypothetical protein